jgi:hypothetical protein
MNYNQALPIMAETEIITEGSRFFTLVPMKVLCNAVFERSNSSSFNHFRHPQLVTVPPDEVFTIDGVLDDEVDCDFDRHDALCEHFVPAHVRNASCTMTFVTCEFVAARVDIIKLCEHIGFEEHPPEYDGPIV